VAHNLTVIGAISSDDLDPGDHLGHKIRREVFLQLYAPVLWPTFANEKLIWYWGNLTQFAKEVSDGQNSSLPAIFRGVPKDQAQLDSYRNSNLAIKCGDAIDLDNITSKMVFDEELRVAYEVSGSCA
jgi:hypothetical protein